MKKISIFSVFVIVIIILSFQSFSFAASAASSNSNATKRGGNVMENKPEVWLTTADQNFLLTKVNLETYVYKDLPARRVSVEIDPTRKFQQMDGFGASLTDSSAHLIFNVLTKSQREELMKKLFSYENGIGISFLRQPMGSSDFALSMYSYDDLPQGVTEDYDLKYFSIEHDKKYIIPLLKEALSINPSLKIMASPWSAPAWMKTSGSMIGGSLKTSCYDVYARYFLKFIEAYRAEGIPIYAITVQNEPLYVPGDYPGMGMSAQEQLSFIVNYLGPLFKKNNIETKILIYDHNWDNTTFAQIILNNPKAREFVAGSAWHCYAGKHDAMSYIHSLFPDEEIWFTEASGGDWIPAFTDAFMDQMMHVVRATRNWAKTVVWWNVALDEKNGPALFSPYRDSTCRGLVKINTKTKDITYNVDYYTMGHISKFVKPGAYRIWSSTFENDLETVAFENPDKSIVLIVSNRTAETKKVVVGTFGFVAPSKSAVTIVWK